MNFLIMNTLLVQFELPHVCIQAFVCVLGVEVYPFKQQHYVDIVFLKIVPNGNDVMPRPSLQ